MGYSHFSSYVNVYLKFENYCIFSISIKDRKIRKRIALSRDSAKHLASGTHYPIPGGYHYSYKTCTPLGPIGNLSPPCLSWGLWSSRKGALEASYLSVQPRT